MVKTMEKNYEVNFHIVLHQPEMPANTGNIGRLCVGSNSKLHIVKPMRFLITDKYVKRAGLDYWDKLQINFLNDLSEIQSINPEGRIWLCTTKSNNLYTDVTYKKGDIFVFGAESKGLPESYLEENFEKTITIPMTKNIRSINLSNSVGIVLYEAWRQTNWPQINQEKEVLC